MLARRRTKALASLVLLHLHGVELALDRDLNLGVRP